MEQKEVSKRIKDGWIRAWMAIEALAIKEDLARSVLEKHVGMMGRENQLYILNKKFLEPREVERPIGKIEKGFSLVVEVEVLVPSYDRLMWTVMNYGPSSVEILEPKTISMPVGQAQSVLNTVSEMMHRFAASRTGGIVIKQGEGCR